MKKFKNQILASTTLDKQGEQFSKTDLDNQLQYYYNKRVPLNQDHDLSQPYTGYMENFSVQDIGNGEHTLVADIFCNTIDLTSIKLGYSISMTEITHVNNQNPLFCIYLPYPLYKDDVLKNSILQLDVPLQVGNWKKKGDGSDAGLIVSLVLFFLSPIWQKYFDANLAPYLNTIISKPELQNREYDFAQTFQDSTGKDFMVYFKAGSSVSSLRPYLIKSGILRVFKFLKNDSKSIDIGVARINLKFDTQNECYNIVSAHYKDGTFNNSP